MVPPARSVPQAKIRDPGLPPIAYLKTSGGQFRDMTIHDFDMARWLLGEEPVELFAYGSCLVDPAVAGVGDAEMAARTAKKEATSVSLTGKYERAVMGSSKCRVYKRSAIHA